MKLKEWSLVILPLVLTWTIDFYTKQWASQLDHIVDLGFVTFSLHHNPGAMLGLFSNLPPILRIVSLSTVGSFLLCIYVAIQYLLPIKSIILRVGLSFLIGGILGNVTDRVIWGYVVDFIVFPLGHTTSPAFNLADALQWVGYICLSYAIIKESELLWPAKNARKGYWVNLKFQLKYCFLLLGVGLSMGVIVLVFSYTYLKITIIDLIGNNAIIINKFITPFYITFIIITLGFCVGLFTVGKIISHKIAGPVFAFEKYINDILDGKNRNFKLRSKDEFKELEELAQKIKAHLQNVETKK